MPGAVLPFFPVPCYTVIKAMNNDGSMRRRKFLQLSALTLGAARGLADADPVTAPHQPVDSAPEKTSPQSRRRFNGEYSGEHLDHIAFPLGGIGAGMICLEGTGALSHFSIRNHPEIFNEPPVFAAIAVKG